MRFSFSKNRVGEWLSAGHQMKLAQLRANDLPISLMLIVDGLESNSQSSYSEKGSFSSSGEKSDFRKDVPVIKKIVLASPPSNRLQFGRSCNLPPTNVPRTFVATHLTHPTTEC